MNRHILFFLLLSFLVYLLYLVFKPFLIPLFWAGVIAVVLTPLNRFLVKKFGRPTLFALLLTLGVILIVIVPAVITLFLLAQESIDAFNYLKNTLPSVNFSTVFERFSSSGLLEKLQVFIAEQEDLSKLALKLGGKASEFLLYQARGLLKNLGVFLFRLIIIFIALFFFLRDGDKIVRYIKRLLPLEERVKDNIFLLLDETINAVLIGMFVTALVQGLLLMIGFLIFGVGYPVLFGSITFVLCFLPLGGAIPVWLGGAIYLFINGRIGAGVGLILWGLLLVSSIDNFLKPILIGDRTKIPMFILFLSLFGGILAFGLAGLFIGPILVAVIIVLLKIYIQEIQEPPTSTFNP